MSKIVPNMFPNGFDKFLLPGKGLLGKLHSNYYK